MAVAASDSSCSKVSSEAIPIFKPNDKNGPTAERWIQQVEQLKAANKWDEPLTLQLMQARLTDNAHTWYDNLESLDHTWEEWKFMISGTFPSKFEYVERLTTMLAQHSEAMTSKESGEWLSAIRNELRLSRENGVHQLEEKKNVCSNIIDTHWEVSRRLPQVIQVV